MRPTPRGMRMDPRPDTRAGDAVRFAARRAVDTVAHVEEISTPTEDGAGDAAETLAGAAHLEVLARDLFVAACEALLAAARLRARVRQTLWRAA